MGHSHRWSRVREASVEAHLHQDQVMEEDHHHYHQDQDIVEDHHLLPRPGERQGLGVEQSLGLVGCPLMQSTLANKYFTFFKYDFSVLSIFIRI